MAFSLKEHYSKLSKIEKILFREKVIDELQVDYEAFYNWYNRDKIPRVYKKAFAEKVLFRDAEEVFPELATIED